MFDSLVDSLKTNIDELNGHEVQISSDFKVHRNKDSKYIIKNWLFSSPEFRKWRITRFDGGDFGFWSILGDIDIGGAI